MAARIADDSQLAFGECRNELLEAMISGTDAQENLRQFQRNLIDTCLSQDDSLISLEKLMEMLNDQLAILFELIAHLQSVADVEMERTKMTVQAAVEMAKIQGLVLNMEAFQG